MTHTAKHTPGPWNVTHKSIIPRVYGPDDNLIAEIHPQRRRDARLIVAAPAMYEALKGMVSMYDSLNKSNKHDGACPCYHCQARAALAQAEGSKP